jgi:hypothetical protein
MTPSRPRIAAPAALVVMAAWSALAGASWQGAPARQVVLFGVLATPGGQVMDPKIVPVVQAQLRRTLPGHGFKLIKVQSQRVLAGQSVVCDLGEGFVSQAQLMNPLDPNGKVQLRYELTLGGVSQFQSIVVTPPDQFNFFDKMLPDNSHLLIGVGAR